MKRLAIGCPVAQRQWILPLWFDHVEVACDCAEVDPMYVFVAHPDDPCRTIIAERGPGAVMVDAPDFRSHDRRDWRPHRYHQMTALRNQLLGAVRDLAPPGLLSVDSDILLAPEAIASLLETLDDGYDAVGGKCFMTQGTTCPSWAQLGREGSLIRMDAGGRFEVDVIMALKLMSPTAYQVDYQFHMQGEDIGWSINARRHGLRLGWDGRVCSKHILEPAMLDRVDVRCGF